MTSRIPRNLVKDMDFWYSSEKWKDILGADEAETICVPPCLDVLKSWKRNDINEASHLKRYIMGQKGEAEFMQNFKELRLGGILVSGLETCDLEANRSVRKRVLKHGEWDAIFFHQNRGIFVIEVKATETNEEGAANYQIEKAKTQLDRNIKNIKQSFLSLYQKECTCITGFICFPFRNEDRDTYEGYRVIGKSAFNDHAIFRQFFEPQTHKTMIEVTLLQRFAGEFVCCRSQVEFHSQAYNAMQVATWIMEQDIAQKQDPTKLVNMPGNGPCGKIILTKQQLEIVECREKCVTIRGAPGSGKTLILMLRALKAAMENKAGSVFVFINKELKAKYEHYFFEEEDKIFVDDANNIDRTPNVLTIDKINFAKPEDDVFFDETPLEDSYIEKIVSRVNCSGSTTVVFTGLHTPGEADALFRLHRSRLKEFKHFKLMKVLRCTGNIFEKWEHYYPHGITIGHSIDGVAVKSNIFDSFEQVQNEIANKIATLTNMNISNTDLPTLKKEHIAVITCDDNDSIEIRNYFDMKEILCGQVNEQARKSTSIVAVDVYLNTPSYEWPIVFIILKPNVKKEEVLPIAASRCIASLIIIAYKNLRSHSSESVSTPEIENALSVKQSLKETYLTRYKKVCPFSLGFTFDIENTWVSLALKGGWISSLETEDHAQLLGRAFEKDSDYPGNEGKILIIEGDPATGKTSLMQRLAYEWANGKQELLCYDLVLYAEFRKVHKRTFLSISDLVLYYLKTLLNKESYEKLKILLNNEQFCEERRILVLLDGYDESSLEKQCSELHTYLFQSMSDKALMFHVVISTRKGYLSVLRECEGRLIFAEVLGFTTKQQKEKYITNHFLSITDIHNKEKIAAVHHLLDNNKYLNEFAEIPLLLTFICLVHERIVDGTLAELYYNIIWWLFDRHQQDFPDLDIPALFGFQNSSSDKYETIQDHFLNFPQLHFLGNMALCKIEQNEFKPSDCAQFNLQTFIEQVGLLRKEQKYDNSFKLVTSFFFPHRTIQEFLAAFYFFSNPVRGGFLPNPKLDTSKMNEFEKCLLRVALFDKLPKQTDNCINYFNNINDIDLDMTFDAFNFTAGFNNKLLSWFLSQCTNVQNITLIGELNSVRNARNTSNDTSAHNESDVKSNMYCPAVFSFSDLIKLHSVTLGGCTFSADSQLSFTNCPSLKNLQFQNCVMKKSTIVGIATLPAIDTVQFYGCNIDLATWQSITDEIRDSSVKCLKLTFGEDFNKEFLMHLHNFNRTEIMEVKIESYRVRQNDLPSFSDLIKLHSVTLDKCTFDVNSQLSFTNCPSLKNLKFNACEMKSSTIVGIPTLPAIDTVQFYGCNIDLTTWQSITEQIKDSSVKYLKAKFGGSFDKKFLIDLQKCKTVEKMEITIGSYKLRQDDLLSFSDLIKLSSLTFGDIHSGGCTFEANSKLLFTNCPSLKNLKFNACEMKSSTIVGIPALPAIGTMGFYECDINLVTWQSITDQIFNSSVKCLQLSVDYFGEKIYRELISGCLKNFVRMKEIRVENASADSNWNHYEEEITRNLAITAQLLPALTSITFKDVHGSRLKEWNKAQIENAGRKRNLSFLVKYLEWVDRELEQ